MAIFLWVFGVGISLILVIRKMVMLSEALDEFERSKHCVSTEVLYPRDFRFNKKIVEVHKIRIHRYDEVSVFILEASWLGQKPILICWMKSMGRFVEMDTGKPVPGGWYKMFADFEKAKSLSKDIEEELKANKQAYLKV